MDCITDERAKIWKKKIEIKGRNLLLSIHQAGSTVFYHNTYSFDIICCSK